MTRFLPVATLPALAAFAFGLAVHTGAVAQGFSPIVKVPDTYPAPGVFPVHKQVVSRTVHTAPKTTGEAASGGVER